MFELHEREGLIDTFEMRFWVIMIEKVVVTEGKKLNFEFRNGSKIEIEVA